MNKYQKALNRLKDIQSNLIALNSYGRLNKHRTDDLKVIHRAIIKLQELVDKETPKKPIIKSGGIERCGKCKYQYNPNNDYYCSQCGQCREWSDEQ